MNKYRMLCMTFALSLLFGCQSISGEEKSYRSALQLIESKSYPQAIGILSDLGDFKDAAQLISEIRYIINGDYIGVGGFLIAAIKSDGTLIHRGGYETSKSTEDWKDIVSISTHGEYIEALDMHGHIVSNCPYTIEELQQSTLNSSWGKIPVIEETPKLEGVKAFQSNYPTDVVALFENGTVKVLGSHMDEKDTAAADAWKEIVAVAEDRSFVVGLKVDGSAVAVGERIDQFEVREWKDIVAISTFGATVGLKEDGTVVAAGECSFDMCKVDEWTDIIAIATGAIHTVGLQRDGTVVSTGDNSYGQRDTEEWKDIVAIDASWYYTLGLKSDGTLVLAGNSSFGGGVKLDVSNMSGLLVPTLKVKSLIN